MTGGGRRSCAPSRPTAPASTSSGQQILAHRAFLESNGGVAKRRRARLAAELRALVVEQLLARGGGLTEGARFDALVDDVAARATDPYAAVDALLADRG